MKNFPVDKEVEGELGWKAVLVDRTSPSLCILQRSLALLMESVGHYCMVYIYNFYLFMYFWLLWVFIVVHGLSLVVVHRLL